MSMKKILITTMILSLVSVMAIGQETDTVAAETGKNKYVLAEVDKSILDEKVIVGNDTVSIIIPEKNYGRYDRGLYNYLYIPKGQFAFGLSASYGSFDADDVELLSIIKDFDFKGSIYSIKPEVSYFFKNNQSIGVKFNYTRGDLDLPKLSVDFDDDLNFNIKDVSYNYDSYSAAIFYRRYIGLDREKRFGLFNDVDLSFGGGHSRFKRYYNNELRDTETDTFQAALNFSPGVCVFIMDYVSFNVSFGVFGVYFKNEKQMTNGVEDGDRFSSGASFRFNLFNINFGLGIHI